MALAPIKTRSKMVLPWLNKSTSNAASSTSKSNADLPGYRSVSGTTCLVTGSSGLCGARLVEMLVERGCSHVVAFDLAAPSAELQARFDAIQTKCKGKVTVLSGSERGDLTNDAALKNAFELVASRNSKTNSVSSYDAIFHLGALVGPFYARDTYHAVNYHATVRLLEYCKLYNCTRFVYSSSPSTRFHKHSDIVNARDCDLEIPNSFLAMYAEAKALGEVAVSKAHDTYCTGDDTLKLKTISVAPHQVYGPHDALLLPNLLEAADTGRLRIFGSGLNKISVTYVDNYCHGLICGADALVKSPDLVGGKFYIVTDDDEPVLLWDWINQAVVGMGFADLHSKWHLPKWLLYGLAYIGSLVSLATGAKFKLTKFNVTMLTIHRYFDIMSARNDLEYVAVRNGKEAWAETIEWFRVNWLPGYLKSRQQGGGSGLGLGGISQKSSVIHAKKVE
ncbi:hypothetical protein MPSEU_000022500 [Mayamaea pseudoterrestris]|nr:hypothetical protein MPSEU_000022500 [Mayamaea pseudoterrestris]